MEQDNPPAKKVKKSKKPLLIALAIILVIVIASFVIFYLVNKNPKNNEAEKVLKEAFESTQKAEVPPSALDPSLLTEKISRSQIKNRPVNFSEQSNPR